MSPPPLLRNSTTISDQNHQNSATDCDDEAMPVDILCSSTPRPYASFLRKLLRRRRKSTFRSSSSFSSSSSSISQSPSLCTASSPPSASHTPPSSSSTPRSFSFGSAKDLQVILSSFSTTLRRQASCGKSRLNPKKSTCLESETQVAGEICSKQGEICKTLSQDKTRLSDATVDLVLQNNPSEEKLGRKRMKQRCHSEAMVHVYCADAELEDRIDQTNETVSRSQGEQVEEAELEPAVFRNSMSANMPRSFKKKKKKNQVNNLSLCDIQRVVTKLKGATDGQERWQAAEEVRKMTKDDPIARITMAMLGVIAPLISMLDAETDPKQQCTALLALLNLAIGNETNKASIVKAKAVPKMVALLGSPNGEVQAAVVTAFLSLSALEGNKAVIGSSSGAIASLVSILSQEGDEHRRKDALRALYNLSIHPGNVKTIVESGGTPLLLAMVEDMEMSEKALATLGNFATTEVGRGAIARHKEIGYAVLVDALRWADAPKSQERAAYILMMIAHHSHAQREAMANAGAITALLELVLLGTPLAQKRASRTLDSFRRAKAFSAPQQYNNNNNNNNVVVVVGQRNGGGAGGGGASEERFLYCSSSSSRGTSTSTSTGTGRTMSERTVVDSLVRQSLNRTMQRIVRRANMGGGMAGDVVAAGTGTGPRRALDRRIRSSSSLPY